MELTPIVILTKDNPEYLYLTLKSLTATLTGNNPIIIVDDCSSMQMTKKFLYTDEYIDVTFEDWTRTSHLSSQELADKEAVKSFLNIPSISYIRGIKGKFSIVQTSRYLGQEYRTLFGINLGFSLFPKAKGVVVLEDDILFNKNWYNTLMKIYNSELGISNVGLISVYNEIAKKTEYPLYFKNNRFQGKMFLITSKFYKKLKTYGYFSTADLIRTGTIYEILQSLAHKFGFDTYTSLKSYIQNLEKRNICNRDKVLKYDDNFKKPIAWNKNF
jgi:hypothetical protein